jgi:hypothetical protein
VVTVGFVAVSALGRVLRPHAPVFLGELLGLFDVENERNAPTWFSSMALAGGSVGALLAGRLARPAGGWRVVAIGLAALSFDEFAGLHERGEALLAESLGPAAEGRVPILYLLAALAVAPWAVRFLRTVGRGTAGHLLLGSGVLVVGAAGVDALGASVWPGVLAHVEEGLEMLGASLLLVGCWERAEVRPLDGGTPRASAQ